MEALAVQKVKTSERKLGDYRGIVPEEILSEIEGLASRLKGLHVAHISSTAWGGGVAEILRFLVPLQTDVGLNAEWYVITPEESLFTITKALHHSLQGDGSCPTSEQINLYIAHSEKVALELRNNSITADVWIIHDPQLLPVIDFLPESTAAAWICHIDTTEPNKVVQDALLPFINHYQRVVFALDQYVLRGVNSDKVCIFAPAIDPLCPKNMGLPTDVAKQTLARLGIAPTKPLVTQVARFDRWKDPWGVIDAYRMAKETVPTLQLALVGVLAAKDDSDAPEVLRSVQQYAGNDPDIHIFSDGDVVADLEVNAFQTASNVILQKSIREGFGLTVAEAMWKGTPVIGGDCGGIRLQIRDGETGFLVGSPPHCAQRMVDLLQHPELAKRMGQAGKESVRHDFLITRLLRDHLNLYASLGAGNAPSLTKDQVHSGAKPWASPQNVIKLKPYRKSRC